LVQRQDTPICIAPRGTLRPPSKNGHELPSKNLLAPSILTLITKPTGAKIPETQYLDQTLMLLTHKSQASPIATQIIATFSCIHLWDMHFNQQSHMQAHAHKCTQEATATFLLLPDWLGWSKNGYMIWINDYPEHACVLAKFPADSMLL